VRPYAILTGRRFERFYMNTPATLVIESQAGKSQHAAAILDYSHFGLRIRPNVALHPGQDVQVFSGKHPWLDEHCRVIWTGRRGSKQEGEAGLEFVTH
jgi:hypothetical protein